jgi:hypothetical protein
MIMRGEIIKNATPLENMLTHFAALLIFSPGTFLCRKIPNAMTDISSNIAMAIHTIKIDT